MVMSVGKIDGQRLLGPDAVLHGAPVELAGCGGAFDSQQSAIAVVRAMM